MGREPEGRADDEKPVPPGAPMFPSLFAPGAIGGLTLRNRAVMSPMGTKFPARDGAPTPRLLAHYRERAEGGVGLVICEYTFIDQEASRYGIAQLGAYDDDCIPALEVLADTIKAAGARAAIQLGHGGRQRKYGPPVVAPTSIPWTGFGKTGTVVPRELAVAEIKQIARSFGDAARRVQAAGFDLVELHGGHGYLITQFLSPRTNHRTDRYGGTLDGRMRFLREVVSQMRTAVGPGFPMSVRISHSEYVDGGLALDDACAVARALEEEEGVDAIHVSAGSHDSTEWQIAPLYQDHGINVEAAAAIKSVVGIPVLVVGSMTSPEQAEEILASGKADFVTFGRALLADAHLVRKAQEGRRREVRPCLRTNDGCLERPRMNLTGIKCSVNFSVGRQDEFAEILQPSPCPGRVVVAGGGPGGLETARVAALRGHEVVLFEERDELGGWLIEAGALDRKADVRAYRRYLIDEIARLGVEVRQQRADVDDIAGLQPDLAVVATGSAPALPAALRAGENAGALLATAVLGGAPVGPRAVVLGGSQVAVDAALLLSGRGVEVALVHEGGELAEELDLGSRRVVARLLEAFGVDVRVLGGVEVAAGPAVVGRDLQGSAVEIAADSVVVAPRLEPVADLLAPLAGMPFAVKAIGDCVRPRRIQDAVHEGHIAARRL